jgi:hypothetical protein
MLLETRHICPERALADMLEQNKSAAFRVLQN